MMRGRGGVRRALLLAAVAATAALQVPVSRADGDPASDVLLEQSVFLPYEAPSSSAQLALQQVVGGVYAHGNRLKVAVIYDETPGEFTERLIAWGVLGSDARRAIPAS